MSMSDWFKSASATFAGGGVAIALVAIPTFIWLPREFDEIKELAMAASSAANESRIASQESKNASIEALERIEGLIISIARMDAEPISSFFAGGALQLSSSQGQSIFLGGLIPKDVNALISGPEKMSDFLYSDFGLFFLSQSNIIYPFVKS